VDRGDIARGSSAPKGPDRAAVETNRRIARCECGAILEGGSEQELYEAAQLHLAQHHPQLLGAIGPEVVHQMAENSGITAAGNGL
jgi:hypothetical protein